MTVSVFPVSTPSARSINSTRTQTPSQIIGERISELRAELESSSSCFSLFTAGRKKVKIDKHTIV